MIRSRTLHLLTVAALFVSGCGGSSTPEVAAGDKAGGEAVAVTLRVGTDDFAGRRTLDHIAAFAAEVERRSGGSLRIEAVPQAGGDLDDYEGDPSDYPGWDQVVARMVVDGELEMGIIPTRTFDTEGVDAFRALNAPFLVTSEDLVAAIVTSDIADEMLAGLDPLGVTGLALVPESLRRILYFDEPPATPHDHGGAHVRAPRSDTTYRVLEALGAVPDDFIGGPGDPEQEAIAAGDLVGAESALWLASSLPAPGPTTTFGDVVLFPKVNALVVNDDTFASLTDEQRTVLRESAQSVVATAIDELPGEADDADVYCAGGGRIVSSGALDRMVSATAPLYDELESDPTTAGFIERIRVLAEEIGAEPTVVPPCDGQDGRDEADAPQDDTAATGTDDPGDFPDGVYRKIVTVDELRAAGLDDVTARKHGGMWTLRFDDGHLTVDDVNDETGERIVGEGVYCLEGGRLVTGELGDPPACGDFWNARWELVGDDLRLFDVRSDHGADSQPLMEPLFGGIWTRIG